jgi:hypothetical protein
VPSVSIVQIPAETPGDCELTRPKAIADPFGENDGAASLNEGSEVRGVDNPPATAAYAR